MKRKFYKTKEFYNQGLVAKIDILQTKVKLSEVKRNLRKARGDLKIAKSYLQNLINKNIDDDIIVEPVSLKIPEKLKIQNLYRKALNNRPVIKMIKIKSNQLKNLEKIEKSGFYPKIFAQAKYFYMDQYPYLDPKENYALTFGIVWQFQGVAPYYKSLRAKSQRIGTIIKLKEIENKIKLQVKSAYEKFLTAKANLKVAEDSLSEAREYYRLVVEQFNNQLASTTDVLDAESVLTSARKGREITYYQLLKAIVDLENAVGGTIDEE